MFSKLVFNGFSWATNGLIHISVFILFGFVQKPIFFLCGFKKRPRLNLVRTPSVLQKKLKMKVLVKYSGKDWLAWAR